MDKNTKRRLANALSRYGAVDMDSMILMKEKGELFVSFLEIDGKRGCIEAGAAMPWIGNPSAPASRQLFYDRFSVYIEALKEGTTREDVVRAFERRMCPPASVNLMGDHVFINYSRIEDLNAALRLRRVVVAGFHH